MGDVVSLATRREFILPEGEQCQGAVALLQDALVRARRGEIQSVFLSYTDKEGNAGGCWDGKPSFLLMSAARLVRRIHNYMDGKGE